MSATTSPPESSSSSITATEPERDAESHKSHARPSHFSLLLDPTGITPEIQGWGYKGRGTDEHPYIVEFLDDDARNPVKFSPARKWTITGLQAMATLATAFVSSAYTGGIIEIIREFQITTLVATLGVSLFVLGFALGPLLWAPLSELYGRQGIFFITFMALTAFNAGAAGAQNIETLLVLRLLGGTFGASPFTNAGGVITDMFMAHERGLATSIFALAPFLGPALGPIAGGFLGQAAGWRWVEGLMATFTGVIWIAVNLVVPETYVPVILRRRAAKLSALTGKVYISKLDVGKPKKTVSQEFRVALSRPWALLFKEPIVFITSIYMAIIYGTLYMMFAAYPIVFQQQKGWSPGVGGLAFVGVAIGQIVAVSYTIHDNKRYMKISKEHGGMAPAESRLPPAIIGSVLLPIGLFWFAWTNGPEIHWVVPIIAGGFFSAGLVMVFLSLLGYLIDSYILYAASALAANSVLRSLFGAAFPLFTSDMYKNLGIHWASSVPAFLALACLPFPFLFWKYGHVIRMKSKFAAEAAMIVKQMQASYDEPEEATVGDEISEKDFTAPAGGVLSGEPVTAEDKEMGQTSPPQEKSQ